MRMQTRVKLFQCWLVSLILPTIFQDHTDYRSKNGVKLNNQLMFSQLLTMLPETAIRITTLTANPHVPGPHAHQHPSSIRQGWPRLSRAFPFVFRGIHLLLLHTHVDGPCFPVFIQQMLLCLLFTSVTLTLIKQSS